jgi:GxxExxY protein
MTDNEISHEVTVATIEVHKLLGPGLLESVYEASLCHEFAIRTIGFQKQKPVRLVCKEIKFDCGFTLDLLVKKRIVVELKPVDAPAPIHEAIMLTYLTVGSQARPANQFQRFSP